MDAGTAPAQKTRSQYRHELRTLIYACVEQANGGIVRNISHQGIGLQVVAAVRPQQQLRVRFELCRPRLRVETRGEVTWATPSGQCGVRFLELSPKTARQINEWIFGNLLEGVFPHSEREGSIFFGTALAGAAVGGSAIPRTASAGAALARTAMARTPFAPSPFAESPGALSEAEVYEDDGLMVSAAPVHVIEVPARPDPVVSVFAGNVDSFPQKLPSGDLGWLSQPLSDRGLIWTINTLVVVAAVLLFALVFLSITGEPPPWPFATASAAAILVAALYWGFFRLLGGASPGARLARMAGWGRTQDEDGNGARFR
jgi:PilZ domain